MYDQLKVHQILEFASIIESIESIIESGGHSENRNIARKKIKEVKDALNDLISHLSQDKENSYQFKKDSSDADTIKSKQSTVAMMKTVQEVC